MRREMGTREAGAEGVRGFTICAGVDVEIPLGAAVLCDGGFGVGQIDDGASGFVSRADAGAGDRAEAVRMRGQTRETNESCIASLLGTQYLTDVVLVDQSPIGRTPRSNPVTYIKAFDAIRELVCGAAGCAAEGANGGVVQL